MRGSDARLARYLEQAVTRLDDLLAERLLAVWLIGSGGLGDYVPGASDLDLAVAVDGPLEGERKRRLAHDLSHDELPVPARLLELVVYRRDQLAPRVTGEFELELNTEPGRTQARFDPGPEPAHWYLLDLAIARDSGRALRGAPPEELIAPVPRKEVLRALRASLGWHRAHEPGSPNAVLNACRGWRFVEEGTWSAKSAAAAWARGRLEDPAGVDAALAARTTGEALDRAAVAAVVERVAARVDAELAAGVARRARAASP